MRVGKIIVAAATNACALGTLARRVPSRSTEVGCTSRKAIKKNRTSLAFYLACKREKRRKENKIITYN